MDINIQKDLQDSTNISTVSHVCIGKLSMTLKSVTENRSASKDNERCTLPQSMTDHHIKERFDDDINRFDQVFVSCLDVRNINKKKFQIEKKCVRKNIDVGGKEPEDVDVEESQEQIITTSTANIMCIDGKYSISETQYSDQDIEQQPGSSVATKEEEYSVINQSVIDTRPTTRIDQSETKTTCPHTFESKNADNRKESQITEKYSKTQTFSKTPIDNEIPIVTSVDSNKFQQEFDYRHTNVEVARVPQTTEEIIHNNKFVKKCVEPTTISEHWHKEYYKAESARRTQHRLDDKLQELRAGLSALREMDLDLLKQLIDISSTIRSIKRADVLKIL
uniref:Uncharacterized protein n=1 Tax=Arion vulgaris TaxID=1028688 RepID=A0A0B7A571_9EUPU